MCTLSISNVIYHKFSHGAAFYTLNGKNVNVMLEFIFNTIFLVHILSSVSEDRYISKILMYSCLWLWPCYFGTVMHVVSTRQK